MASDLGPPRLGSRAREESAARSLDASRYFFRMPRLSGNGVFHVTPIDNSEKRSYLPNGIELTTQTDGMMPSPLRERQKRLRMPISTPMSIEEIEAIDGAAALRDESRAQYIRRVAVREARAELRKATREQGVQTAPAA